MKYSIVIPTYNHCDDLLKPCVESILKYSNLADIELIIVANGCNDETESYLQYIYEYFKVRGLHRNFSSHFSKEPLGYAKATNKGIELSTTDRIILLNNDTILLDQKQNEWLDRLEAPFFNTPNCGVSCVVKAHSYPAGHDFAIFFCVMIDRKVFDKIGLLNLEYGKGAGEDTEFCIEAEKAGFTIEECMPKQTGAPGLWTGQFPIYHKGEGTVHDASLVPDWHDVFFQNSLRISRKYNPAWYHNELHGNYERHISIKGETVPIREQVRYMWAGSKLKDNERVLEVGCSNGYGTQFLPNNINYTGVDYNSKAIAAAIVEEWKPDSNFDFVCSDIYNYEFDRVDTIIAFEIIEHIEKGLELVEFLKTKCDRLLMSVPYGEPPGLWGPHHKMHWLTENHFPGMIYKWLDIDGTIMDQPSADESRRMFDLMLCEWTRG
jgi:glycosyltransferase involved in cell wall biosynthesis